MFVVIIVIVALRGERLTLWVRNRRWTLVFGTVPLAGKARDLCGMSLLNFTSHPKGPFGPRLSRYYSASLSSLFPRSLSLSRRLGKILILVIIQKHKINYFQVNELPNNGAHIPVVQQAEALMRRLELEQKVYALLDEAMQRRDLNALTNGIAGCDRMIPPLVHEKVDKAREMKVGAWRSSRRSCGVYHRAEVANLTVIHTCGKSNAGPFFVLMGDQKRS